MASDEGVQRVTEMVDYQDGSVVSRTVIKQSKGTVTLFAFDAGQGLSEHTAPFDALVHVVEGRAEIQIDKQPHELGAGELLLMPANRPHALRAVERFKMILTMIRE